LTAPAIAVRGLEKRFGFAVALGGIDLAVPPGRSLAVLGANGAGKSTLLRLVAGLARPSAGVVEIDGLRAHGRAARARVGLVAHASFLYAALSARENLVFAARLHGVAAPAARAAALLEEAGLAAVADQPVGGFSRGMAQRVAIARGLVHDPAVLILDEPFTGLDRRAAERLAARLGALRAQGRTLLLATHDVDAAARLADAAVVLARGRVAAERAGPLDAADLERALAAAEAA